MVFMVEIKGVEPLTSCLQGRRSSQLSYSPKLFQSLKVRSILSNWHGLWLERFLGRRILYLLVFDSDRPTLATAPSSNGYYFSKFFANFPAVLYLLVLANAIEDLSLALETTSESDIRHELWVKNCLLCVSFQRRLESKMSSLALVIDAHSRCHPERQRRIFLLRT